MKKTVIQRQVEGRSVRFTNFIDDQSFAFEREAAGTLSESASEQTLEYLRHLARDFFLLQIRAATGVPAMQACVYVGRTRGLLSFAMTSVPNLNRALNGEEEEFGMRMLRELCREVPGAMTLRLQPKRFVSEELDDFEERAARSGFRTTPPLGIVRTVFVDLGASGEDLLASLPGKTRAKFRHRDREKIELRTLTDSRFIDVCRRSLDASRGRSGGESSSYDLETAFALARSRPDRARIVGLFLKGRGTGEPKDLLAFAVGFRTGEWSELSAAGSFADPELRSLPFNYFLFWEIARWAREQGSLRMDLGGITDGGENDPFRGISRFKRAITERELEIGREMVTVLRPLRFFGYRLIKRIRDLVRGWIETVSSFGWTASRD